ncbi:MAG: sodium:proton antiporter, partial [Gammaproteobacteria bacterium RIFCSPHIGHO2_12_FULL_38_14]
MHGLAPLIYDLALMLGLAAFVVLIFQRIHQPVVLGYLLVGMIIGPFTPPRLLLHDIPNVQLLSELGVIFLMFYLGLEFSFQKLSRVGFSASITGLIEIILMMITGYLIGRLMQWNYYDSLFLGAALSISSTTIIVKAISELKLNTKRFAELVVGVLIVEDLAAILILVSLSIILAAQHFLMLDIIISTLKLFLVIGGWFLLGYFLVPPLFREISTYINEETLTVTAVALCLLLVCIAAYFEYSTVLGAFIMGSILAETILIHRIKKLIQPIRDIFAAVFFISVGTFINPISIIHQWKMVVIFSLITIFGKLITTSVAAFLSGQSVNTSIRTGCSMAQIGEFSFIIVGLGLSLNVISEKVYPLVVAISAVTTFTTPYLIRFSGWLSHKIEDNMSSKTKFFLDSYSAWVYRLQAISQRRPLFHGMTVRLFINGIIVLIIFMLINKIVMPEFSLYMNNIKLIRVVCLFISFLIASPFIWGMLFSYKSVTLPEYAKTWMNPAMFIAWFVTLI